MKSLACIPRCHRIVKLALILTLAEICAFSAEPIDFPALDRVLHSVITNRQISDTILLQAISRLGPVTEPPSFWWSLIDDSSYSLAHRTRALHALFRRHGEIRRSATDLRDVLGDGKWLHEATFTKVTYVFGFSFCPFRIEFGNGCGCSAMSIKNVAKHARPVKLPCR